MENSEDIQGYYLGHDDGYCQIPARFLSNREDDSFIEGYLIGYYDGKELRSAMATRIEKLCNCRDP